MKVMQREKVNLKKGVTTKEDENHCMKMKSQKEKNSHGNESVKRDMKFWKLIKIIIITTVKQRPGLREAGPSPDTRYDLRAINKRAPGPLPTPPRSGYEEIKKRQSNVK
jgi:hypothetical protein